MKSLVLKLLERMTDFSLVRKRDLYKIANKNILFEKDEAFFQTYHRIRKNLNIQSDSLARQERYFNLQTALKESLKKEQGAIVECGCWLGFSSLMMIEELKKKNPNYQGEKFHLFDSFEGLPATTEKDVLTPLTKSFYQRKHGGIQGAYAADLQTVKNNFSQYPQVEFHVGYIPETFKTFSNQKVSFVSVDVNLYEPTKACLEFFYPQLVPGGIMVCDDYGSLYWPGAKDAIDEFCDKNKVVNIHLSNGQSIIVKA